MNRFRDQVVVVIGAATGLGRSMAEGFALEGAKLVIADVDPTALEQTLRRAENHGANVLAVPTDVMRKEAVDALAAKAIERFGRVDIVCSNAGVNEYMSPAWEKSPADWQWVMGVNLYGLVHAVNAFIPILLQQGSGHFVCTASNTSLHSTSGVAVYVASKKAALGFCEALQYDLWHAQSPVKVSIICPNKIASEMPNSARNRPISLAGKAPSAEELKLMSDYLADGGHTPDEAAAIVLDGIAEQRFYILTNPIDAQHTEEWSAGVRQGRLFQMKTAQVELGKH
jgi:NAD(P)-dependent dehydrogenase (short-subunit alcohol dehydrogenase family)